MEERRIRRPGDPLRAVGRPHRAGIALSCLAIAPEARPWLKRCRAGSLISRRLAVGARLADYVYVSFTNAIAFSPTDAMPFPRRANAGAAESAISATTVLLVAAGAVNILRGPAPASTQTSGTRSRIGGEGHHCGVARVGGSRQHGLTFRGYAFPSPEVIVPQALSCSDLTARRMNAVVAVFRGAVRAGGLDARAGTATRTQRPRRVSTFTGATPIRAVTEVSDGVRRTLTKDRAQGLPPIDLAESK